jgi:hypothetical protein
VAARGVSMIAQEDSHSQAAEIAPMSARLRLA